MNATLGEIALNHALTHADGHVDEVILDHVDGAAEAVRLAETHTPAEAVRLADAHTAAPEVRKDHGQTNGNGKQQAPRSAATTRETGAASRDSGSPSAAANDNKLQGLRQRGEAMLLRLEELTKENPRRALALAAGAGLVVGVTLLSFPLLRTLAKGAASAALKGEGAAGLTGEVGSMLLDKLESILPKK